MIHSLFATLKLNEFSDLLEAYIKAGYRFQHMIDGGAGFGSAAREMLPLLSAGGSIYCFEPFPGNHRFFADMPPQVKLIRKALAAENGKQRFYVRATVNSGSDWGQRGMEGYSSLGKLVDNDFQSGENNVFEVEKVAADAQIPASETIDFVKLDLQGGEQNALDGMKRISRQAYFLYVEYTGQPGLVEYLLAEDFLLFDMRYLFLDEPTDALLQEFEFCEQVLLSTGRPAWYGFKKSVWPNYLEKIAHMRKYDKFVTTDLICVHRSKVGPLLDAIDYLMRKG